MSTDSVGSDERGISEIYGTILVIALAFAVSVLIIGAGFLLLSDSLDESGDRQAQDSIGVFDDCVSDIVDGSDEECSWQPADDDIELREDEGTVNVSVSVVDEDWNASRPPGKIPAADNQTAWATLEVGTLRHETEEGLVTAYQAGAVFEKQDDSVSVVETPNIQASSNQSLNFNFISIAGASQIDSEGMTIQGSDVGNNTIQQIVTEATEDGDGNVVARAKINVTITSEFAEGWARLAENSIDIVDEDDVYRSSELAELDENQVRIAFGAFGESDTPTNFKNPVMYSGKAKFGSFMHNENYTLAEAGPPEGHFSVENETSNSPNFKPANDDYKIGIHYRHKDGTRDWWTYDRGTDTWHNIENASATPLTSAQIDGLSGSVSDHKYPVDNNVWVCAVDLEHSPGDDEFRDYVDSAGDGCLSDPFEVTDDEEDSGVADFEPLLEIENLNVDTDSTPLVRFRDNVSLDVTIKNNGTGDATLANGRPPVAVTVNGTGVKGPQNLQIVGGKSNVTLDRGDTTTLSGAKFTYGPDYAVINDTELFNIGASTRTDFEISNDLMVIRQPVQVPFDVTIDNIYNQTAVAGQDIIKVDVNVTNLGDETATQYVSLSKGDTADGRTVDAVPVTLDPSGPTSYNDTITLEWKTKSNDAGISELNVSTYTNGTTDSIDIKSFDNSSNFEVKTWSVQDPSGTSKSNFEITEGEELELEVEIENTGNVTDTQNIRLRNGDGNIIPGSVRNVTLNPGNSATLDNADALAWDTTEGDEGSYPGLTIETDDDSWNITELNVTAGNINLNTTIVSTNDPVDAGQQLNVTAEVQATGTINKDVDVWLQDFDGNIVDGPETEFFTTGDSKTFDFTWQTEPGDAGTDNITVGTNQVASDSKEVEIQSSAGVPDYVITDISTNSSIVEGEKLSISVDINNVGTAIGTDALIVELPYDGDRPVASKEVTVDHTAGVQTYTLTWNTIVGDATNGTKDINVRIGSEDETEEILIQEKVETRDPVDVMFALDETGSMGDYDYNDTIYPFTGGTVPSGVIWYDGSNIYIPGDTVSGGVTSEMYVYDPDGGSDPLGKRIGATKTAIDALNTSSIGDRAGVLEYAVGQNVYTDEAAGVSDDLTSNAGALKDALRINPGGGTDITGAVQEADDVLDDEGRADASRTIILLTDGYDNRGDDPSELWTGPDPVDPNTTVYTVGFGNPNNSTLQNIATQAGTGDGQYFLADNASQLADVFEDAIDNATEPETPAFDVVDIQQSQVTVPEGETANVSVELENNGADDGKQIVTMTDFYGRVAESREVFIPQGDSKVVNLTWQADLQAGDDPVLNVADGLLVRTPDGNDTVDVRVEEGLSANFGIGSVNADDSVNATEEVDVEVTVANTGSTSDTQTVTLFDDEDMSTPLAASTVSLDTSNSTTVTLTWQTTSADAGDTTLNVTTEDDYQTENVTLDSPKNAAFLVTINRTNATASNPLTAGGDLVAEVQIENNGTSEDTQVISYLDTEGDLVDLEAVTLNGGSTKVVNLTWSTNASIPSKTGKPIKVKSNDDDDTEPVWIESTGNDSNFVVTDITPSPLTVEEGDPISFDVTVNNTGSEADTQFVEVTLGSFSGSPTKGQSLTLPKNSDKTFKVTFDTEEGYRSIDEVFVSTDNNQTSDDSFNITAPPTAPKSVEIDPASIPSSVTAGDPVTVTVDTENISAGTLVSLASPYNEPVDVAYLPSMNGSVTLTWQTVPGQGAPSPQTITAKSETAEDDATVQVNIAPAAVVGDPGNLDDNPIGISIEEIAIS